MRKRFEEIDLKKAYRHAEPEERGGALDVAVAKPWSQRQRRGERPGGQRKVITSLPYVLRYDLS